MMKNFNDFYVDAIEQWRLNAGKGTMLLNKNTDARPIVLGIIQRIYEKNPSITTLIFVKDFQTRANLIEFLTSTPDEDNNAEIKELIVDKYIKIISADYAEKLAFRPHSLNIVFGEDCVNSYTIGILKSNSYKLCILSSYIKDTDLRLELYSACPMLNGFDQNEIQALRATSPIEEMLIGIDVTDEDILTKIKECDKYISQSMSIFGSYDIILKARMGDRQTNVSATTYCLTIAEENGWNNELDMSIPYNVEIDKMYNPNALNERASITGEVINERAKLVTDYFGKLEEIGNIIDSHKNEKILVISKRGEFANQIAEYLNYQSFTPIAGGYNDKLPTIPAIDSNSNPILIKTGKNAGEPKMLGSQAQSTKNLILFNNNRLNVLCVNNSPDKKLECQIDVVIITSPLCDNVEDYIYRLDKVSFAKCPLKVYTIYCKNTIEQKNLSNRQQSDTHKIVNKNEISAEFDKNVGYVLVD